MSRAWPSGRRAGSPRDMASAAQRRRGALRRPGRAAPTRTAGGQGGRCHERGLRAGGPDRRGIWRRRHVGGGVVLFDAQGERLRPAPLKVKEGVCHERGLRAGGPDRRGICNWRLRASAAAAAWCSSTPGASGSDPHRWRSRRALSRAWPSGREGQIAAGYARRRRGGGGVVLFDARGERLRPAPLEVKEGDVNERGLRAGGPDRRGIWRVRASGGVVLFDARGERLRPAPLEVKEGSVTSVAFGPEGQIAAGYLGSDRGARRRRGALRRPGRAAPTRAAGGQGGLCHERGLRAAGPDRRGISSASAASAAAWCSSTPGASGSDPRRWRSRRAMS